MRGNKGRVNYRKLSTRNPSDCPKSFLRNAHNSKLNNPASLDCTICNAQKPDQSDTDQQGVSGDTLANRISAAD